MRPVYLDDPAVGTAFLTALDAPADGRAPTIGVLLCAPFGYDAMCAHRGLRAWAQRLAGEGGAALRFDLPGSGDSAGTPRDPGLAATWSAAVGAAARHLRAQTGCRRVVAVGLGLGGMLAASAASDGAPIDDLVLWGVPARGRALVRELRAFARLGVSDVDAFDFDAAGVPSLPEGSIESGGFLMTGETAAALAALDVAALDLSPVGRALLLGRDGVSVDARIVSALERGGAQVTVADGPGWSTLLDEPHLIVLPEATMAAVGRWLDAAEPAGPHAVGSPALPAAPAVAETLSLPGGVVEAPVALGEAVAVIARPDGSPNPAAPCVVLLNVGAERRVGPNRMWVEAARRWASRGVVTVRLDLPGIGDAGGAVNPWGDDFALYCDELVEQTGAALDALARLDLSARFALVGLCSGAYWAFQHALGDPRVVALMLVNARMLLFDETLGRAAEARHVRRVLHRDTWRQVRQGRLTAARVRRLADALLVMARRLPAKLAARLRARRVGGDELDLAFDRLRDQGTTLGLWFTDGEPVRADLQRSGHLDRLDRWPNITVGAVPGPPDTHTLQVVRMQPLAHALLDDWLAAEIDRARTPAAAEAA